MGQGCCSFETSVISQANDKMVIIQENTKDCKTLKTSSAPESADEIGFSRITEQLRRKVTRKGFRFKLMVVGEPGLGKSTFINTLFSTDIYLNKGQPKIEQTLKMQTKRFKLEEKGVELNLTIVDTPGFGAHVDNSQALQPILDYIDDRYKKVLESELSLQGEVEEDMCLDACLYFIASTGHGLKEMDIQFLKNLNEKVNIIPVIAKSDAFMPEELGLFKQNVSSADFNLDTKLAICFRFSDRFWKMESGFTIFLEQGLRRKT